MWDYGKDITVSLEDALFSAKSMAIMFGNGEVKTIATHSGTNKKLIMKTEQFTATATVLPSQGTSTSGWTATFTAPDGSKSYTKLNPKFFDAYGTQITSSTLVVGQKYLCTYDLAIDGTVIEISANSFPGTYYVTGDTYARSEASGEDEFFQFIIPKAKVTSENTITLEAEGDPSVFNMNLQVLRPADGVMMKLVKYELVDGTDIIGGSESTLIHNHNLSDENNDEPVVTATATVAAGSTTTSSAQGVAQVISSDTAIATASVGTNSVTISGVAGGTATITALNGSGVPIKVINVTVTTG
jgi:hypothetical protein